MARFMLSIETDNAAFVDDDPDARRDEIARILEDTANRVRHSTYAGALYDINGNRVGEFGMEG